MGQVYVAGSMNMDVVAFTPAFPAPGETLLGERVAFYPGGKGLNPSVAAVKTGISTSLIANLGADAFGEELFAFAEESGIDVRQVHRLPDAATGTAIILVSASGENSIVVIPGANGRLSPETVSAPRFESQDVLLSLFEIPLATVEAFLKHGRSQGARTVLSPSPVAPFDFLDLPDFIVLNEGELAHYSGSGRVSFAEAPDAARQLQTRPSQSVIVTLGADGAVAVGPDGMVAVPGRKVAVVDTTGAGDCFVGSLAARLAEGDSLSEAMSWANVAASICVTRPGAAPSMPSRPEVLAALAQGG